MTTEMNQNGINGEYLINFIIAGEVVCSNIITEDNKKYLEDHEQVSIDSDDLQSLCASLNIDTVKDYMNYCTITELSPEDNQTLRNLQLTNVGPGILTLMYDVLGSYDDCDENVEIPETV